MTVRLMENYVLHLLILSALLGALPFFRPLWDFWAGTAAEVARLLLLPLTLLRRAAKKLCKTVKKVFLFFHLYGKI